MGPLPVARWAGRIRRTDAESHQRHSRKSAGERPARIETPSQAPGRWEVFARSPEDISIEPPKMRTIAVKGSEHGKKAQFEDKQGQHNLLLLRLHHLRHRAGCHGEW